MTQDEPTIFVGMRVADLPKPYVPSVNRTCAECRAAVWISKAGVKDAFATDKIVCTQCAVKLMEAEQSRK